MLALFSRWAIKTPWWSIRTDPWNGNQSNNPHPNLTPYLDPMLNCSSLYSAHTHYHSSNVSIAALHVQSPFLCESLTVFSRTDFSHPIYLPLAFSFAMQMNYLFTKRKRGLPSFSFLSPPLCVCRVPSNRIDWFLSRRCVASSFFPLFPRKWAAGSNTTLCLLPTTYTLRSC